MHDPKINCSVQECMHNSGDACTKNRIMIGKSKSDTRESDDTLCESFEYKQ